MLTRNDLIWKINHGDDIMFDVRGRHFSIFTWDDEGIRIIEQNKADPGQQFKTPEMLVDNFTVDGTPLMDILSKVEITSYTLVRN